MFFVHRLNIFQLTPSPANVLWGGQQEDEMTNEQFRAEDDILARTMTDTQVDEVNFAADLAYALVAAVQNTCERYKRDDATDIIGKMCCVVNVEWSHEADEAFEEVLAAVADGKLTPRQVEALEKLKVQS